MTGAQPKRRVFVSFEYEDRHYADLMDAWAANENNEFDFYDERLRLKVNSTQSDYIKRQLREKIDRASVLVCIIGPTTMGSSWVRWEGEYAIEQGKGLVGVKTKPDYTPPSPLVGSGTMFVPFEQDQIERAIEWAATSDKKTDDWVFKD